MLRIAVSRIACLAALLLSAVPPLAATAQAPIAASHSITVAVQATTPKGEPVRGLTAADFHLLDNKSPHPITAVKERTATVDPAHIFIVVDAVNIDYSRVAFVRSELQKYLTANPKLAHPTTFVVVEDKGAQVQKGFSTSGSDLLTAFNQYDFGLRTIRRNTGYWGATERTDISLKALNQLTAYAASIPGRKLILWVSPGWPLLTGARTYLDDRQQKGLFQSIVTISTQMRNANVTLNNINPLGPGENLLASTYYQDFTKGVRKPSETEPADLSLQVLAVQSGGQTITNNSDVAGNITRTAADADGWYDVTFDPAPAEKNPEYHHIQFETKPGVVTRTRDGYYAMPEGGPFTEKHE